MKIIFSDYLKYRAALRGFDLAKIEEILRHGEERYLDTATGRLVVIGKHGQQIVMIPYEQGDDTMTPITIHVTTRQQIKFRLNTGRFAYE